VSRRRRQSAAPAVASPARSDAARRHGTSLAAALVVAAILAAWANSLRAPFVFDDRPSIVDNPTIRHLWPLPAVLSPPADGSTVTSRPVLNLSFALNHAAGGLAVEGYHVANILIHAASALLLLGLVRRTLGLPWAPDRLRDHAGAVAPAVALLWGLHPLHTGAVTYIAQRAEALAGLLLLATLFCFARAHAPGTRYPQRWHAAALAACWLGVAAKETLVAAPLLLLLYDRTFVAGSWREAWRRRRIVHGLAFLSWVPLGALLAAGGARGGSVGFGGEIGPWPTLLTQADALVMYLGRAAWPAALVFDHGPASADCIRDIRAVVPQGLLVLALLGATAWALLRRPAAGFLGAWFFLILAPTSSVVPVITQMRAEHRMYLPLAALVVGLVILLLRLSGRRLWALVALAAVALAATTVARNRVHATALALWTDTAARAPANPRAHYNLGFELAAAGRRTEAVAAYTRAVTLDPRYVLARVNIATLLTLDGRAAEALPHAQAAAGLDPDSATALGVLGRARFETGDAPGAIDAFARAVQLAPDDEGARRNLGLALLRRGEPERALEHLERAAALRPDADLLVSIAGAHHALGRTAEARRSLEAAVRLRPGHGMAHFQLGQLLVESGDPEKAVPHFEEAARAMPRAVPPLYNLGLTLHATGRTEEAIRCFEKVLLLDPRDTGAAEMLRALRAEER